MDSDIIKDSGDNIILFDKIHTDNMLHKLYSYKTIIQKTLISTQHLKTLNIISSNELKIATTNLHNIFRDITNIENDINNQNLVNTIDKIQKITDEISSILRNYGTQSVYDMLSICFGTNYINNYINKFDDLQRDRFDVINKFCHPISYKLLNWSENKESKKEIIKNKIIEDIQFANNCNSLEGFDLCRTNDNFYIKVYGGKFIFKNFDVKKTLIINTLIDDIILDCTSSTYLNKQLSNLLILQNDESITDKQAFDNFVMSLTIKDFLIYNCDELKQQFINNINQLNLVKQKTIIQLTREFLNDELFYQRQTIIQLLIYNHIPEYQYLAYLLYDLLTNDSNDNIDTQDQITLFDSFSWSVKSYFREAMKQTINYTNNLALFDNSKIPLEQQICLLKANETTKAKAMVKLKEVKAKSEDSGAKARQYLESLLKIPFGIFKSEPILKVMKKTVFEFTSLLIILNNAGLNNNIIPHKLNYTSIEAKQYTNLIKNELTTNIKKEYTENIIKLLTNCRRTKLIENINHINVYIKLNNINYPKLLQSGKKINFMQQSISNFIKAHNDNSYLLSNIVKLCNANTSYGVLPEINEKINLIDNNFSKVNQYFENVSDTLDRSVYGHKKAKRQVERIIGQWINGEDTGYCLGFEGPPGVGKTSLAKNGISECLKDDEGSSRPFAFIAIGGSSNASTLDGHNYTYVGSTWGRICDILMETRCMNPIIFIDELDKVSKTENGKEIIGILTHLIDPTQNDTFQDKYFSGIDLDLSKALFIFSYNDVSNIDRILLDRIHRVKFEYLTLDDKLVITKKYLLPEIYNKMGLNEIINLKDEIIEFIINEYTCEPGVRKLKEILFEIIGEINLDTIKSNKKYEFPLEITIEDIKNKYLKNKLTVKETKIHTQPKVGLINGMWANSMGQGGILPIECCWCSGSNFLDLKLTGMQGDVMKESMSVAKTIATNLAMEYNNGDILNKMYKNKDNLQLNNLHIHVPEGSTPKDGPSAGAAITSTLYSQFTNRKINNEIAMTGEINLQGKVTAIGGLDLKVLGAIRAGVKIIIYPEENQKDFEEIHQKNINNEIFQNIKFHAVSTIQEVIEIIFI